MIRRYFSPAKYLGCLLLIVFGLAKADITQCIDEAGRVLYTDGACTGKTEAIRISPDVNTSEADARIVSASSDLTDTVAVNEGVWAKNHVSARRVAVDVETMKAARSTMSAMDQSHSPQHQNLIALDQRSDRWFDFR